FSDAAREDLPASFASGAALTIHRPDGTEEAIPLQIDAAGESWTGAGRPVETPEKASVRVAFTIKGEPYWIDLPFAAPAVVHGQTAHLDRLLLGDRAAVHGAQEVVQEALPRRRIVEHLADKRCLRRLLDEVLQPI